jgi:hypothetical protein
MKRSIFILLILFTSFIYANPIDASPSLSEIKIVNPDNWFVEIVNLGNQLDEADSIILFSNFGSAKVESFDTTEYVILTQNNFLTNLQLQRTQDFIKLYIHYPNGAHVDSIKIGDCSGSRLHNIDSCQSIMRRIGDSEYFKNDISSLGEQNELNGSYGKIYGHFYYQDGTPITERYARFYRFVPNSEYVDASGYYKAELVSHYYCYNWFYLRVYGLPGEMWDFSSVDFDLEPGDSLEVDFYALQTSIRPVIQSTIKFNNYPHPASSYTWFVIDNTDVEASAMRVNVYALNGRKVDSFKPRAYQYRYDCSHLPQGSYIMSLQHGREVLATKKLQILK